VPSDTPSSNMSDEPNDDNNSVVSSTNDISSRYSNTSSNVNNTDSGTGSHAHIPAAAGDGITGVYVPADIVPRPHTPTLRVPRDNPLRSYIAVALTALNYTMTHVDQLRPLIINELTHINSSDARPLLSSMDSALRGATEMAYGFDSLLDCRRLHAAYRTIVDGTCTHTLLPLFTVTLLSGILVA
jgi:hypothetical protein